MPVEITTQRLRLREFRIEDLPALEAINADPEFHRFEYDSPWDETQLRERLERILEDAADPERRRFHLAVTIPPGDTPIGWVALIRMNPNIREWEIGWSIRRDCWGQGYASEAARAMLDFARSALRAHRVAAFCHADNAASRRVMEKIGLEQEGKLKQTRWLNGRWWDEWVYAAILQP